MPFTFPPPDQLAHLESYDNPDYPIPGVPVDKGTCRLLGPTALVVQALMGLLVVGSLVFKRQREKPMRPWRIWLFDVSKQALGQAFVHGLNLLISDIVAQIAKGNPCDLYFLNVLLDTTLGVGYIYLVLHGANVLFTRQLNLKGFQSGEYGDPPSINYWARQATIYVLTILSMKLLIVALFAIWPGICDVAQWLLGWTGGNDNVQVIFVMGIFPITMNVLQFWLIDSIVKASAPSLQGDARAPRDATHEPLIRDPESEDDEDDDVIRARRRVDIESPPTPQILTKSAPYKQNASEYKSSASSSGHALETSSIHLHPYPPEHRTSSPSHPPGTSTPASASPSSSSSMSSFRSKKSRRRSPPPPIQRPPPHHLDPGSYTISMTPSPTPVRHNMLRSQSTYTIPSSPPQSQARQRHRTTSSQGLSRTKNSNEVGSYALADEPNWAEKVGEEDWTGRRMGTIRAKVDTWGNGSAVQVS